MYDMTPAGANYYTELQEMHIQYDEVRGEYEQYMKSKRKYRSQLYAAGSLFWLYYVLALSSMKQPQPIEDIEKAGG